MGRRDPGSNAVACGQGRDARRLADLGAEVVGIDASESLLAHARRLEQQKPRGIVYIHDDAQDLRRIPDASFDAVVCHIALMDIPELEPTVRSIARILTPGGWFVASIVHPCYKTPADGELMPVGDRPVWQAVPGLLYLRCQKIVAAPTR